MQSSSSVIVREIWQVHFSTKILKSVSLPISILPERSMLTTENRPLYELGIWSMIVSHLIEVVLVTALGFLLRWENQKRDRIQSQMEGGLEGRNLDATAFLDLTDRENLKYALSHPAGCLTIVLTVVVSGISIDGNGCWSILLSGILDLPKFTSRCTIREQKSF